MFSPVLISWLVPEIAKNFSSSPICFVGVLTGFALWGFSALFEDGVILGLALVRHVTSFSFRGYDLIAAVIWVMKSYSYQSGSKL